MGLRILYYILFLVRNFVQRLPANVKIVNQQGVIPATATIEISDPIIIVRLAIAPELGKMYIIYWPSLPHFYVCQLWSMYDLNMLLPF